MKRIAVLLAAILIATASSFPAAAEPDESSEVTSSAQSAVSDLEESVSSAGQGEESMQESGDDNQASEQENTTDPPTGGQESTVDTKTSGQESAADSKTSGQESAVTPQESTPTNKTTTYRIEEADMSLAVPSEMYVITRKTDKDDPVLSLNRTTKDEVMKSFQENDIYFRAVTRDFSCVVNVTVSETEDTQAIGQLLSLSEENQQSIIDKLLDSDIYTGCTKSTYHGVLFFTFRIMYDNGDTKIQGVQQYTIVNGKNVRITYQTAADSKNDPNRQMFDKVMDSIQFERLESSVPAAEASEAMFDFWSIDIRYVYIGIAGFIGLLSLIVIVSVGRNYRKSKRQLAAKEKDAVPPAKAEETAAAKPAEEEKDIFSDTTKKQPSALSEKTPPPKAKPMTYEDVISARPQVNVSLEHTQPIAPLKPPEGQHSRRASVAATRAGRGDEVVFAQSTEKRRTEIEQISPPTDKATSGEPMMSVTPPRNVSSSTYEQRFGKNKLTPGRPTMKKQPSAMQDEKPSEVSADKPTVKDTKLSGVLLDKPDTDSGKMDVSGDKPVQDNKKPAAFTDKSDTEDKKTSVVSADKTAADKVPVQKKTSGIELDISTSADGSLVIGATKENDGQPMDIEVRDETRLSEEEDKRLEAMGFETARHNEIYNAVSAAKDEKPFVVKPKPRPKRKPTASVPTGKMAESSAQDDTKAAAAAASTEESEVTDMRDLFANDTTSGQQLSDFERNSGIQVERAPTPKRPVVPMQTAFTDIPRLESVNAEEYNRRYDEMKKTMPKNHAYAQRFRTNEPARPSRKEPEPVETEATPAPLQDTAAPSSWEEPVREPAAAPVKQDNGGLFEYYTGYDAPEETPAPLSEPTMEEKPAVGKKKDSMGSRFRRSLGKFFAPDPPFDESDDN